ncbi:hypothetical protein [Nitrospina watsonii]|uniref:Uncharacterized protein n=1 Tax=Nitrospina watsonii TaxID=1323948 RepID=A0ABN8W0W9_9BACT|nr:hypothetical protein [Nitrospina watsonii]CAI2719644.1 conserved exported protein of unknown function [Nitrospina watsonii]
MNIRSIEGKFATAIMTLGLLALTAVNAAADEAPCPSVEEQPVKIEAWLAKRLEPEFPVIRKEMARMGFTRVALWPYPAARNPSKVVAIGRCVPAYIARHALQQALYHFGGVRHLVHQKFVHDHWIGLGTSLFAENSLQPITLPQLQQFLDPRLGTPEFQTLYRRFTVQDVKVPAFGLELPNPKLMK